MWADYDTDADPLVDPLDAIDAGATAIFAEHGSNQALVSIDRDAVDLEAAAGPGGHIVRGRYVNQRMAVVPMEPNGCVAVPEPDGRLTFYASTQMPHGLADQLAGALAIERDAVRVVTPQVGGGFGGKAGICPEYSAVAGAARSLGRPVTWVPTRSEDLVSLPHSRAQVQHAELAVDADGRFRALRVRLLGDAGAYPSIGAYLPGLTKRMSNGVYEIDAIQFDVAVAVTNTTPTGAYRGAGRPEATALLERLVGQAALELDIDPIELRRRNLIAPTAFPFTAHSGAVYDSGNYVLPLDVAADAVGYVALREEQARRRADGRSGAARHRRRDLRGDHRRGRRRRVRCARGARGRLGDRARRHPLARTGPPDGVRDARPGPHRHPGRADHPRRRRHRPRATRRGHRRLAVAADRRVGGRSGGGGAGRAGTPPGRVDARGRPGRRRGRHDPAGRSASPACRPRR